MERTGLSGPFSVKGYTETEDFDFKEVLPDRRNDEDKERLTKSCCAFANSNGGFLIFGISDNKALPVNDRLVGIPRNPGTEFQVNFGIYPQQKCFPGWNAPHAFLYSRRGCTGWGFVKRTNTGNQDLSYEEIRMAFLQYYEKRLKLQLLRAELQTIKHNAGRLTRYGTDAAGPPPLGDFSLTVLETTLADTYTILMSNTLLLGHLTQIRNLCGQVNSKLQSILPVYYMPVNDSKTYIRYNTEVTRLCEGIISTADLALQELDEIISAK